MQVLRKGDQATDVRLTRNELILLNNALNEVCNGVHIEEPEFSTRLGSGRDEALSLLAALAGILRNSN
jgi:hypothetical protein